MKEAVLLLVDDEAIIRKAFSRMITKEYPQVKIVLAEHGLEALDMVAEHHPDMMILDLGMMHMGGFEVLQQLAQRNQVIPTLVMSAYGHGRRDGVDAQRQSST